MSARKPKARGRTVPHGPRWPLAVAKARLSEIARRAREEGPQIITSHGQDSLVVEAVSGSTGGLREEPRPYHGGRPRKDRPPSLPPRRFWSEASKAIGDDLVLPERTKVSHRDAEME